VVTVKVAVVFEAVDDEEAATHVTPGT